MIPVEDIRPHLKDIVLTGVLHVGAHECEEVHLYEALGITPEQTIWIDAQADKVAQATARGVPNVYHCVMSDVDGAEVTFNLTNNSQSSSILPLGTHSAHHPSIWYVAAETMIATTVDAFFAKHSLDSSMYNFWNLDVQGAELLILRGGQQALRHVDVVYLEVNTEEVYVGCALLSQLDAFLLPYGLERVVTLMTPWGWGDAVFVKRKL